MELDAKAKARMVELTQEMNAIHYANSVYWNEGNQQTVAARTEYQLRNERVEKIRAELAHLRDSL